MPPHQRTRRTVLKALGAGGATLIAAGAASAGGDADVRKLNELRAATAAYHDPSKAVDDGYARDDHCVTERGGDGAMGYHYLDFGLLRTPLDHTEPEALVYERRENRDHLVAVEFLSTAPADGSAPRVLGHEMDPFTAAPFANWELHAWVWKPNPRGLFADYNPRVDCPE